MAVVEELSRERTRELVQSCFVGLKQRYDVGYRLHTDDIDLELEEQEALSQDHISDVQAQIDGQSFEGVVLAEGRHLAATNSIDFEALNDATRIDLLSGVARAIIESQRLFIFRLADRLQEYNASDPLFAELPAALTGAPVQPDSAPASSTASPTASASFGPTVGELVDKYLSAHAKKWTAKTLSSRRTQLGFVKDQFGLDRRAATITDADIRDYRNAVTRLRSNHHVGAGKSFLARQTDNEAHRIAPKTVSVIFEASKAMFRWARADGYLAINPAEHIRFEAPKVTKAVKSRRPFSEGDLKRLFAAPVFTGCLSINRRFEPGDKVIQDAKYWIPILGLYTGMRLGELVQLHLTDVYLDASIPYLDVTDAHAGPQLPETKKHIKSQAGIRRVPLHPAVMKLGFADFVGSVAERKSKPVRLFWEVAYGADTQASTTFSKWFARLMDSVNLKDPALVFHSFRHTVEDALRNALQPQYVIDRIVGHSDDATSAQYGAGVSLATAYAAISKMEIGIDLPAVLSNHGEVVQ